jgi:signal transduction histidine kinase/CheY-like chemotaxis protein
MPLLDYGTIVMVILACMYALDQVWSASRQQVLLSNQALTLEIARRRDAQQQAVDAAHARSTFLATMSHEIRTPLNGVLGVTQVLLRTDVTEDQHRLLNTIHQSGSLLRSLLDDILDFSKVDSGQVEVVREPTDLRALTAELRSLWLPTTRDKGIRLDVLLDDEVPPWVMLDARMLRQVLGNLLANAIKFTSLHGEVTLEVRHTPEGLTFSVRDTGEGIPVAAQGRIFDVFVQVDGSSKRRHGGSGLGLAISQRLVACMGGELGVVSEEGVGSTFSFTIPRDGVALPEPAGAAQDGSPRGLEGLRVLVVDDHGVNRMVVQRLLTDVGMQVGLAHDGGEAIARWRASPPDCIIMDCQMPVCDGYEATRRIRAEGGTLPIIALTANAMPEDIRRCLDAGMNDHLGKPVDRQRLLETLGRWSSELRVANPSCELPVSSDAPPSN